jgi:hypothetical protein
MFLIDCGLSLVFLSINERLFLNIYPKTASLTALKAGLAFIVDHIPLKTCGARLAIEANPRKANDAILLIKFNEI